MRILLLVLISLAGPMTFYVAAAFGMLVYLIPTVTAVIVYRIAKPRPSEHLDDKKMPTDQKREELIEKMKRW